MMWFIENEIGKFLMFLNILKLLLIKKIYKIKMDMVSVM